MENPTPEINWNDYDNATLKQISDHTYELYSNNQCGEFGDMANCTLALGHDGMHQSQPMYNHKTHKRRVMVWEHVNVED